MDKGEVTLKELLEHCQKLAVKGGRVAVLYLPDGDSMNPDVLERSLRTDLDSFLGPMGYRVEVAIVPKDEDRQATQEDAAVEEALQYMNDGKPVDAVCPRCNGHSLEPKVETNSAANRVSDSPSSWSYIKCCVLCDDCGYCAPFASGARAAWAAFTDHSKGQPIPKDEDSA